MPGSREQCGMGSRQAALVSRKQGSAECLELQHLNETHCLQRRFGRAKSLHESLLAMPGA